MLRLGCLGLVLAVAGALVGCLEGRAPLDAAEDGAELAAEASEAAEDSWAERGDLAVTELSVEASDRALCRALAARERRCAEGDTQPAASMAVEACAERYACSRQLWRADVRDGVYACLEELPCAEPDPEFTCLADAAAEVEPSAAELAFERAAERANEQCGALVEVAPAQSDLVYDALTFCLTENEGCEAKAACSMATLRALVDEVCGPAPDEPAHDA